MISRDAVNAMSGLVIIAVYRIDPVFCWYAVVDYGSDLPLYGSSSTVPIGTLVVGLVVVRLIILLR